MAQEYLARSRSLSSEFRLNLTGNRGLPRRSQRFIKSKTTAVMAVTPVRIVSSGAGQNWLE